MPSTTERGAAISPAPPARPRLLRQPDHSGPALLDGPAGNRVVRLGWFATMSAGLLTAISASDQRTDLVTIPPHTSEQDARAAMEQAVQSGNRDHAPAILAALRAAASPLPAAGPGSS